MIEQDTVKLLRECDAGIKMGIRSIEDVEKHVKSGEMKRMLGECRSEHQKLEKEIEALLKVYGDDGKAQFMHDYFEIVPISYLRDESISVAERRK